MKKTLFVALMFISFGASAQVQCLVSAYTKQTGTHVDAYWRNQTACHNGTGGGAGIGPAIGAIAIMNTLTAYLENRTKEIKEDIIKQATVEHKIVSCAPSKGDFTSRTEKFLIVKDKAINKDSERVYDLTEEGIYKNNSGATLNLNTMTVQVKVGMFWALLGMPANEIKRKEIPQYCSVESEFKAEGSTVAQIQQ